MRVSRDWTEVQKHSQHFKQRFSLRTHDWDLLHYWHPLELLGWGLCWELSAKVKDLNEKSRRIITKLIGERMVEWATKYTPSLKIFYFSYYKIYFCCWNFTWKLAQGIGARNINTVILPYLFYRFYPLAFLLYSICNNCGEYIFVSLLK